MIKGIKVKVSEKGPGIGQLVERLGGLGHLTLGVQGDEAWAKHSESELMVGQIAAIWELGLAHNGPRRAWLSSWIDANQDRMGREARAVYQDIIRGKMSRKRGFEKLGYQWAKEIRENLMSGRVTPGLKAETIRLKGHAIPLFDSGDLHNAIGYKVFLPHWKNVPGGSASGNARLALAKTIPAAGTEVKGSPQPPDKSGALHGPKEPRGLRPKYGPRKPPRQGPKQEKYGPRFSRKYAGKGSNTYIGMRARKPGVPSGKGVRKLTSTRARSAYTAGRAVRKSSWAMKWIKKIAKKILKFEGGGDGRNHGYKGSSQYGKTGRAGRRR